MERRQLEVAVARWRDAMNDEQHKEDGAATVIKRIKVRLFRQAFDRYKEGVALKKRADLHNGRCLMFLLSQDERLKKQCYENIRIFVERFQRARHAFKRLDTRLNISRTRQGYKKWQRWD